MGSFTISRPEEVIQRNRSFSGELRGMRLSQVGWRALKYQGIKDKSVRGVRKDVRIEGPDAKIRRSASDRMGVEVKEL